MEDSLPSKLPKARRTVPKEEKVSIWESIVVNRDSETHAINHRFFEALAKLIETGKVRSYYEFTQKYKLNKSAFARMRKYPETSQVPALHLRFLVTDYDISAGWLLTGKGDIIV